MYSIPQDEKRNQELLPILNQKLDAYENILSEQKYLAGDVRTIVIDPSHTFETDVLIVSGLLSGLYPSRSLPLPICSQARGSWSGLAREKAKRR